MTQTTKDKILEQLDNSGILKAGQEPKCAGWMQELFARNTLRSNLRKKIIIVGESNGELRLDRDDSKLLASILRDYRDPKNIMEA